LEMVQHSIELRGLTGRINLNELTELAEGAAILNEQFESIRRESNRISRSKGPPQETDIARGRELKVQEAKVIGRLEDSRTRLDKLMQWIPNVFSPDVPVGDESCNVTIKEGGIRRNFDFTPLGHHELSRSLDLVDSERGVMVAGQRYAFLKNELVLMRVGLT